MAGFKRGTPGCFCCSTGVPLAVGTTTHLFYYNHNKPNLTISRRIDSTYGEPISLIGIDIERKYILIRITSSGDIRLYDPQLSVANADKGLLYSGAADISSYNPGIGFIFITYFNSIGLAHFSSSLVNEAYRLGSLDSNGDFLNGPYTHTTQFTAVDPHCLYTMNSTGDIYSIRSKQDGVQSFYRIVKNDDHINPTVDFEVDIIEVRGDLSGRRFEMSGFMYDGTNFYVHLQSNPNNNYSDPSNLLDSGFYQIDMGSGAITLIAEALDITGRNDGIRRAGYGDWNVVKNRFEGFIVDNINTYFCWYNLDGSMFRKHVPRSSLVTKWIIFAPEEDIP